MLVLVLVPVLVLVLVQVLVLGLGFGSAHPVALVVRLGRVGDGVGGHEPNLVRARIGVRAGARLGLRSRSERG